MNVRNNNHDQEVLGHVLPKVVEIKILLLASRARAANTSPRTQQRGWLQGRNSGYNQRPEAAISGVSVSTSQIPVRIDR
jgi:hypothetical protein